MSTTLKTPEELLEILQYDGLDECLRNSHRLDEGQQTQVRYLILDFAYRPLNFAPVGEESPRTALAMAMALKTARLYLDGNATKEKLEEAITAACDDAAYDYAATAAAYAVAAVAADADADADAAFAAADAARAAYAACWAAADAADPAYAYAAAAYAAERNHQKKELKKVLESMMNKEVTA